MINSDMETTSVTLCFHVFVRETELYQLPSTRQKLTNILFDFEGMPVAGRREGNTEERVFLWAADLKVFQQWMRMKLQHLRDNLLCSTSHQKAAVRWFSMDENKRPDSYPELSSVTTDWIKDDMSSPSCDHPFIWIEKLWTKPFRYRCCLIIHLQ